MTLDSPRAGRKPRWKLRRGRRLKSPSAGVVLQREGRPGVLDLQICVAASSNLPLLTPVATGALSEAIRKDTGIISWLHWPDLVTIDDRAVGRVSVSPSPDGRAVVIQVLVNCSGRNSPASNTDLASTSIRACLGVEVDKNLLREKILEAIGWYSAEWERGVYSKLVARVQPSIPWMGGNVKVKTREGAVFIGKAVALDESGSLVVEPAHGSEAPARVSVRDVESVLPVRQLTQLKSTRRTLL